MDDDLDDLFGEGPSLQLPVALPKGLINRVDELCHTGCTQKLVWSRIGCVAYLSTDDRGVILQNLQCDPRDGQWNLSKQYPLEDVRSVHGDTEIAHLSWSHTGHELAVVDVAGRTSTYSTAYGMNRCMNMKRVVQEPEDNLGSVVGMMWLYSDRPERQYFHHKPMFRENNNWNFSCTPQKTTGPKTPKERPGIVQVTRAGKLKIVCQTPDSRWTEIKHDLHSVSEPSELLTHAGICPDKSGEKKDGLLLVTHNVDGQVRLYRAKVDFEKSMIYVQTLKVLDDFAPLDQEVGGLTSHHEKSSSLFKLCFLDLVPSGPESKSRSPTQPFVLAGFSYLSDDAQTGGEQLTVMSRWEVEAAKSNIHPIFGSLSQNKVSGHTDPANEVTLKRLPDRQVTRTLLGVQQVNVSTIFALLFSDGTVEFRDRLLFESLKSDENENQISSLPQIGFGFLAIRSCLQVSLSPNGSAVLGLDESHSPFMNLLQYGTTLDADVMSDSFFERTCEAFVLSLSSATLTHSNYTEDLLYTLQNFSQQYLIEAIPGSALPLLSDRKAFKAHLLSEIQRVLGIQIDSSMSSQPEPSFRNQYFQRCLNLQSSLGFSGEDFSRSLPALVAWAMLQTRYCTVFLTTFLTKAPRPPPGMPESELKNPESVYFLLGIVSWFMTLIGFIMDELFTLSDHFSDVNALDTLDAAQLNQYLHENVSPVLLLLLVSTSRATLRLTCRWISHLANESKAFPNPNASTPNATQAALIARPYRELDTILAKSLVDLPKADHLLGQIDASIKSTYSAAGSMASNGTGPSTSPPFSPESRARTERDMLIRGIIPEILVQGVVRPLLTTTVDEFREQVNAAELYFADVDWLGLTLPPLPSAHDPSSNTPQSKKRRSRKSRPLVDIMRKVILRRPGHGTSTNASSGNNDKKPLPTSSHPNSSASSLRLRRCTRCCAFGEDVLPSRSAGLLITGLQRDCLCGGRWIVLDGTEDADVDEEEGGGGGGEDNRNAHTNGTTNGDATNTGVDNVIAGMAHGRGDGSAVAA